MSSMTAPTSEPNNESKTEPQPQENKVLTAPDTQPSLSERNQKNLGLLNGINGQLALLVEDNRTDLVVIPLNLYNKTGKVTLSVERSGPGSQIWGAKFGQWAIPEPTVMTNAEYPPGFGVLVPTNKLFVSKHSSDNPVLLVRNSSGGLVFLAREQVNINHDFTFGRSRQTDIKVFDAFKREVLFCRQLLRFSFCMSSCCMQCMKVMAQPSVSIGKVRQKCKPFGTEFVVETDKKDQLFRVKSIQSGLHFDVISMDNKPFGKIVRLIKDDNPFSQNETPILSLEINENVDPIKKSLLMSVMFLIKNLYFK